MSHLSLVPRWHDHINQVEPQEPITGGEHGNANLATRQLGENVLFLKQRLDGLPPPVSPMTGFEQSFKKDGYAKLPNGLIFQWGTVDYDTYPGEKIERVTFPMPFPHACLNTQVTRKMLETNASAGDGYAHLIEMDREGAVFSLQQDDSANNSALRGLSWFAVGY
ncbi:MAG: hypothetical protein Q4B88_03380 [Moraxella sp.]|nr:hypothetical protein [Moraxella sp.]